MTTFTAFILGLLVGWLVEWVIDWLYWRRRGGAESSAECQERLAAAEASLASYQQEAHSLNDKVKQLEADNAGLMARFSADLSLPGAAVPGLGLPPVPPVVAPIPVVAPVPVPGMPSLRMGAGSEADPVEKEKEDETQEPERVEPDDLEIIVGIGPVIARQLNQNGIYTFEQLAAQTPARLRELLGALVQRLADEESFIAQARQLAEQKQARGAGEQ